mmetsp:Transcript_20573/g.38515  ORF Transcript_20573/g.38515 Transcript_20573/m.38515 type:complete len:205 (-) Transcript_20573:71-685(-)
MSVTSTPSTAMDAPCCFLRMFEVSHTGWTISHSVTQSLLPAVAASWWIQQTEQLLVPTLSMIISYRLVMLSTIVPRQQLAVLMSLQLLLRVSLVTRPLLATLPLVLICTIQTKEISLKPTRRKGAARGCSHSALGTITMPRLLWPPPLFKRLNPRSSSPMSVPIFTGCTMVSFCLRSLPEFYPFRVTLAKLGANGMPWRFFLFL